MNLAAQFKSYLQNNNFSPVSVKNYLSDVKKFLNWRRSDTSDGGAPAGDDSSEVNIPKKQDFQNYWNKINQNSTSTLTLKRYQSSLRKFGQFLQDEYALSQNPAVTGRGIARNAPTKTIDPEKMLNSYEKSLEKQGMSAHTIRNYLADTRQFLDWMETI